jgi:hypothetical protein
MKNSIVIALLFLLGFWACTTSNKDVFEENPELPFNPFDTIDYSTPVITPEEIDPGSFLGIQEFILSKSCAEPGCHDGSFEPDYRTVQSSYNTLLYHPVFKNYFQPVDGQEPLPARVVPGEPELSMFYHRVAYDNPPGFEQMPATGIPLPDEKIEIIRQWILDGAKDPFGNAPMATSSQPNCYGVGAFLPGLNDYRVDTIRGGTYNPFYTLIDQDVTLWFLYADNPLLGETTFGSNLTYNKIQLSKDRLDFSNAVELDLEVPAVPLILQSVYSEPFIFFPLPYTHRVTFNPQDLGFEVGDWVYIRTFTQDDDHNEPTEIPDKWSNFLFLNYFSFFLVE